ncbi:MAG: hypothetical protein MSA07_06470 [Mucispirillum sp.]|nr:hypothetical protein [Mucispirillum sp.]
MAIIIKNYKNDKGFTSDLYVKVDSLHNMGEANKGQVVLNTTQWVNADARADGNIQPIYSNKVYIVKDRAIQSTTNLINVGYQLLKADLVEKGYTVEDDLNTYGEDLKAEQLAQQEQLSQEINDGTE